VRLVVFPEAFVPGYPDWVWLVPARDKTALSGLYGELLSNGVAVPSKATERLCRAARRAGVNVVIGVSERNAEASGTSLYNSLLYIDSGGRVAAVHRKLVPTGGERLVWAQGGGASLHVVDMPVGRVGGLICWENYMPLARFAMYAESTEIYAAPTWDHGEPWLSTLRHIAKEGRVFVIGSCMALRRDDIPERFAFRDLYPVGRAWVNPGGSAIVDPDGPIIAGPLQQEEALLIAEIDLGRVRGSRWILDVAGHYARPDVFQLTVRREEQPMVRPGDPHSPAKPPVGERKARGRRTPTGGRGSRARRS
jgi:nitrilase